MSSQQLAMTSGLCAAAVWLLVGLLRRSGLGERIVDRPNARSLHKVTVPRIGGLAIMAATVAVGIFGETGLIGLATIAGGLTLLGLADDRYGLPVLVRLLGHCAAAIAAALLLSSGSPLWQIVLLSFLLTWSMNLYNFMDGADGIAAGMAVVGFGSLALAAAHAGEAGVALFACAAAGAALGFLPYNWAPARVFMGDAGSVPLGFLAGTLGAAGWKSGAWPAWFPVLVFSPFVADASVTLLRRAIQGQRVWESHRQHLYQRLVRSGWGHRRTAVFAYSVMLCAAASSLVLLSCPKAAQFAVLAGWLAFYATVFALTWRLGSDLEP
jgi:phospho-N-acetylmuramoyl-pentapeptide-transferase